MAVEFAFPQNTLVWCRVEHAVTPHSEAKRGQDKGFVHCQSIGEAGEECPGKVHAVEVISTYASDTRWGRNEVMPPFGQLHPLVQWSKVVGRDWRHVA